jgi:hypothetical protein
MFLLVMFGAIAATVQVADSSRQGFALSVARYVEQAINAIDAGERWAPQPSENIGCSGCL